MMKKTILDFSREIIGKGSFFVLLFVFVGNVYGQQAPTGDPSPYFCSKASWKSGGLAKPGDNLGDLQIYGENLKWYEDAALTKPISNPDKKILVDGTTYYVTQTVGGKESPALKVTVTDRTCGCIKEPDFETQDNKTDLEGYTFYSQLESIGHRTCNSVRLPTDALITIPPGSLNDRAIHGMALSPGTDQNGNLSSINLSRTNPADGNSQRSIRVGKTTSPSLGVFMTKEFVAGEVISFNFAAVLESPGHDPFEVPYMQVRVLDKKGKVVASRCTVSVPEDCIFEIGDSSGLQYTEWACMKLNTLSIQGEYAQLEIYTVGCSQSAHYGYVMVDDFYVGSDADSPCQNASFGYLAIKSIAPDKAATGNGNCYVVKNASSGGACPTGVSGSLPFPIEVCGKYTAPASSGNPAVLDDLEVNILKNGVVVGTVSSPTINTGTQTFCFSIDETDINVSPPFGQFEFEANINYDLDCGDPYELLFDDRSSVQICPPAGCPVPLIACDDTGTGFATFDLTQTNALIRDDFKPKDVGLSFYKTQANALNEKNKIKNPKSFTNTVKGKQTIYVRLDWKLTPQGCTYLVKLDLEVKDLPKVDLGVEDEIVVCGDQPFSIPLVATPSNLADLNVINYNWFKSDTVRLPSLGSIYYVTEPGKYSVTVSNDVVCEVTETVVVERVDFSVDLGDAQLDLCDVPEYTLTANTIDEGSNPPLDPSLYKYKWSTGDTTKNITITESGTYTVDVTYKGCTQTESIIVNIADRPEISLGADFEICSNGEEVISASVANFDSGTLVYTWYRDGGVIAGETGSSIVITEPGTYRAEAHEPDAGFCVGEDEITVTLYANEKCVITQGISPNGDQYNQGLDLTFLNDRTGIASVEIFNRHGRLVYEKTGGYTNQWFGQTTEGDELGTGTYFYVIKLDAVDEVFKKQVLTGWVYINRELN